VILDLLGYAVTRVLTRPRVLPPDGGIAQDEVGSSLWNCAALPIPGEDGSYWVAHRAHCPPTHGCARVTTIRIAKARRRPHDGAVGMEVVAPLFDMPVDDSIRCSERTYSVLDWLGPEDPRLLLHDGQLLVVYNDLHISREGALVRRLNVARFAHTSPDSLGGLTVSVLHAPNMRRVEKNWGPLPPTSDGLLRFVYSIQPHTVLGYEPGDLCRPVSVHTTYPRRMRFPFGSVGGGTNAVPWRHDERGRPVLIAVAHVTTVWRWYLSFAYTFLGEPPFTVLQATPPLKLTRSRVEFAQSLFPDPASRSHVLVWGEDNARSHALRLPDRLLDELLAADS
jgi:hypothetical protein